ncbi:hypothetical protein ACTSKR_01970 [Chitinibacteraceae bacterium HSL-7]
MNLRATHRVWLLDLVAMVLLASTGVAFALVGRGTECLLAAAMLCLATRHCLNDWHALDRDAPAMALRTTERSWQFDTLITGLMILCVAGFASQQQPALALLSLGGSLIAGRHWLNGLESLHSSRNGTRELHYAPQVMGRNEKL